MDTLATEGGTPVRTRPFPQPYWGAAVIGEEEMALVQEVIRSRCLFRDYGDGTPHMVNDFEREAREYLGANHALGLTSGSAALYCAMAALGIGPGDEVIMPALIWRSDFQAPLVVGATPVFAEIDRTLCLDPADFERKITPRTKAVIVVHFMGGTADMDAILAIAEARGIAVIEDCAQAFGATNGGRKIGGMGDVGCFSLQHNKIVTTGDGGLLTARDPVVFERAVRYHDLGLFRPALKAQAGGEDRVPEFAGLQFRMNEMTGAVALAQLRGLDRRVLDITRRHSQWLRARLREECPGLAFRAMPDEEGDAGIAFYMDLDEPDRAQRFSEALAAEGLQLGATTRVCNMLAADWVLERRQVHPALPPFGPGCPGESLRYHADDCPRTDSIMASFVCIPITPAHTDDDMDDIRRAVVKVWAHMNA